MDQLKWGYVQLGLFALAFGGLQVWWISSTIRKRELARPMSEGEFRRSLERILARRSRCGTNGSHNEQNCFIAFQDHSKSIE